MKYEIVTSFNKAGYEQYGKEFIKGYKACCALPLVVFTEGFELESDVPHITYLKLEDEVGCFEFHNRHKDKPEANGIVIRDGKPAVEYRLQAVRFSKKVYAITSPRLNTDVDYRIWLDGDIEFSKWIPESFFNKLLDDRSHLAYYIGRQDWDHSECGFVAYNMQHPNTAEFLEKFRATYDQDEVFNIEQWHDSYIFDMGRIEYEDAGITFGNISAGIPGRDIWPNTVLAEYMIHKKGALKAKPPLTGYGRYDQLLQAVAYAKPKKLVEVGTWNGERALLIAQEALKHQPAFTYIGFDLFEEATDETDKEELNVKQHNTKISVFQKLQLFAQQNTGFAFELVKGNTRETLLANADLTADADMAFIDGGHSLETIKSDYEALKHIPSIMLDDYYLPDPDKKIPDTSLFGCNVLVDSIEPKQVLPHVDKVKDGGLVGMVALGGLVGLQVQQQGARLVVKSQNSVDSSIIHKAIEYALQIATANNVQWLKHCTMHNARAVIVSGGPSISNPNNPQYAQAWAEIREAYASGSLIVAVKSSHDLLIAAGIKPWACVLLDPRPHVGDFIKNPSKDVIYFVSSQCCKEVWQHLVDSEVPMLGYHAAVGTEEHKVIHKYQPKGIVIGGGTTSTTRAINLLATIGFVNVDIYGVDSCYESTEGENHGVSQKGKEKLIVTVLERQFITDPELILQSQDFGKMAHEYTTMNLEVKTDGLCKHVYDKMRVPRTTLNELTSAVTGHKG